MNCISLTLIQFKCIKMATITVWKTGRGWALSVRLQNVYFAIFFNVVHIALLNIRIRPFPLDRVCQSEIYFVCTNCQFQTHFYISLNAKNIFLMFLLMQVKNKYMWMIFLRHWHAKLSECLTLFSSYPTMKMQMSSQSIIKKSCKQKAHWGSNIHVNIELNSDFWLKSEQLAKKVWYVVLTELNNIY